MAGLLDIQSVAGAGPSYTLTVASSTGVSVADHVVAPLVSDNSHGGIYRVTAVPTGTSIDIEDDQVPGGGAYGLPEAGSGGFWTPLASGVSDAKANATPYWGDIAERDHAVLDGAASTTVAGTGLTKSGDTIHVGDGTLGNLNGLNRSADDLAVAVDNVTTEVAANVVQVKDGGISTAKLAAAAATPPKIGAFDAGPTAEKASPVSADRVLIEDSADALNKKWAQVGNLPGGGGADEKAKVSANDTTAGYLSGKLVAGFGAQLTELNDGANESLEIGLQPSGVDAPGVQARNSVAITIANASPTDVAFDTTDVENTPNSLQHDDVDTDRIQIKETGLYWGYFGGRVYINSTRTIMGRCRLDDTTVIPGSYQEYQDISGVADDYSPTFNKGFLFTANAGQYLTFQVWKNATGGTHELRDFSLSVVKLEGAPIGIASCGELLEDNDAGTPLVLTTAEQWYKWVTSTAGESTGNQFIDPDAVNDKLIVGAQGAGIYVVNADFAGSMSNAAVVSLAVYKNGVKIGRLETHDQKSAGQSLDLGVSSLVYLAPTDELELYFKASSPNVTLTINKITLLAARITAGANASTYSETVSAWTADTGLYRADITHNLDTEDIIVQGFLTADKKNVGFEDVERLDTNTVRVWVAAQETVRVVIAASGGSAGPAALASSAYRFEADQLQSPDNADWAVNALAPLGADSNNAGLSNRSFVQGTETGVGFSVTVPAGVTNMKVVFKSRAETTPAGTRTVGLKLYNRGIPGAVESWSVGTVLADIDIPTSENWVDDEETIALSTMGVTAGEDTQFELTRIAPSAGTELTSAWDLLKLGVEFS